MKKLLMLLLLYVASVAADDLDDIYVSIQGVWTEKGSNCPVTIEFNLNKNIIISSANTKEIGIYKITGNAVLIPKDSSCWNHTCYELEYDINESNYVDGCSPKMKEGKYEFVNFRVINNNLLEIDDFIFEKAN